MTTATAPRLFIPSRPVMLRVSPMAHRVIVRDLEQRAAEHVETGGPLHGTVDDQGATITGAGIWPADTSERHRDHVTYRLGDCIGDDTFAGTWHNHPAGSGTTPSAEDIADTAETLRDLDRDCLVVAVVSYRARGELARGLVDASAYLVRRDRAGTVTYEPMAVWR